MSAGGATTTEVCAAEPRRAFRERLSLLNVYVFGVGLVAIMMAVVFWIIQTRWSVIPAVTLLGPNYTLPGVAMFLLIAVLADRYRLKVGDASEISAGFLADFLSAALLGPLPGALVAAAAFFIGDRRVQWISTFFNASAFLIIGGTTGVVYWWGQAVFGRGLASIVVGGLIAGCVYFLGNIALFYPVLHLRRGVGFVEFFDEGFRPFLPFHMFFLALSLGLIYSFDQMGPPGFALFFLPVVGLVYAFRTYSHQRELARSLERFSLQIAASMITALDLKDNYTAQHSAAVAQYARDTASALGMSHQQRSVAHLAGLLHDLGKISVPDEILNSRNRLSSEERSVIQGHASAGQSIMSNMSEFTELGSIIKHHHEKFDGSGYPDGLAGEQIPQISRIVAVADSYSAMVSDRPYSRRRRPEEAIAELKAMSGLQYDPRVVDAFLRVLDAASPEYRMAEQLDFKLQFQKARFLGETS